jgi:hypothetical protein
MEERAIHRVRRVHVPFLRGAVSGACEVEGGRQDAIELPSLPMTMNRVR